MVAILPIMTSPFGVRLREWRRYRGISQLALAGKVGATPRHISFLETGRSRPSRQMVLRLGEALDASLRERNELLAAAGLPPAYPHPPVSGSRLGPYLAAVRQLLAAHEPYPGMVLDRHWNAERNDLHRRDSRGRDGVQVSGPGR